MEARNTELDGALLLRRDAHRDARGTFDVLWNREELPVAMRGVEFVQDNLIKTRRGTLRSVFGSVL